MWINWEKEIFEIKMNLWRRKLSRPINKCPFLIGVPDQTNRKWEVTSYALVTKKLLWERIPQEPIIVALEFPVYWVNPSIKDWIRNNPSMNRRFEIRSVWSTNKLKVSPSGLTFAVYGRACFGHSFSPRACLPLPDYQALSWIWLSYPCPSSNSPSRP